MAGESRMSVHCRLATFRAVCAVITVSICLIGLCCNTAGFVMADDGHRELRIQLQRLQAATNITLMMIPRGVAFRFRVDEKRLPNVACVYQIQSGGSSYASVQEILARSIIEFQRGPIKLSEVRFGIMFKNGNDDVQSFYFEDWGGAHPVNGLAGEYRILAAADLLDRLLELVSHQDVILIRSNNMTCPPS
jgi:hypothetical protein